MDVIINTSRHRQVIDITGQIERLIKPAVEEGLVLVTVLHTTAALTTADLDPGTDLDLLDALNGLIAPQQWRHPHDPSHAPEHLLASTIGPSVALPVRQGRLVLGTWQRLVLVEFSGPRERKLAVTFVGQQG